MGVKDQPCTQVKITRLTTFRQNLYDCALKCQKDAQWELCDALLTLGSQPNPAYLSQAPCFHRGWSSVYGAIEDGTQDTDWLFLYLLGLVEPGAGGIQYFALDTSAWVRKSAVTVAERGYVHQATNAVKGGEVSVGYTYSFLTWVTAPRSSWALPVHEQRVKLTESTVDVAVQQVTWLSDQRRTCAGIDIVAADGTYGTSHFLGPLRDQARLGIVVRLAKHRVLRGVPPPRQPQQRGRNRRHGARFAFKDPSTWPAPEEQVRFEDAQWGTVELRRWNHLHEERDWQTPFDVVHARVHLERAKPPDPVWLGWLPPHAILAVTQTPLEARFIWYAFQHRWAIEPQFRFRKQALMWTRPRWLDPAACDRWTVLVDVAFWPLCLARPVVADQPLPWQPPQARAQLTPARVLQSFSRYFPTVGTPAQAPQPRGKSPGWPTGRPRRHRPRCLALKK